MGDPDSQDQMARKIAKILLFTTDVLSETRRQGYLSREELTQIIRKITGNHETAQAEVEGHSLRGEEGSYPSEGNP